MILKKAIEKITTQDERLSDLFKKLAESVANKDKYLFREIKRNILTLVNCQNGYSITIIDIASGSFTREVLAEGCNSNLRAFRFYY